MPTGHCLRANITLIPFQEICDGINRIYTPRQSFLNCQSSPYPFQNFCTTNTDQSGFNKRFTDTNNQMQNGPSRSYKMVQILFLAGDTVKFIGGNFCKISSVLKMRLSGWNFQKKKFEKPLHHSQGKKITVWKVIIYLGYDYLM